MKAHLAGLCIVMLLAASCSPRSIGQQSILQAEANRLASCHEGPDCTAKWARAQAWLAGNSAFPLETRTDSLLETTQPPFYSPKSGYTVALEPQGYGFSLIDLASSCGLIAIACDPPSAALRASFVAFVMAGPAPAVGQADLVGPGPDQQ